MIQSRFKPWIGKPKGSALPGMFLAVFLILNLELGLVRASRSKIRHILTFPKLRDSAILPILITSKTKRSIFHCFATYSRISIAQTSVPQHNPVVLIKCLYFSISSPFHLSNICSSNFSIHQSHLRCPIKEIPFHSSNSTSFSKCATVKGQPIIFDQCHLALEVTTILCDRLKTDRFFSRMQLYHFVINKLRLERDVDKTNSIIIIILYL